MRKETSGINVFQKYLTIWVLLCMAVGILIGRFLPQIPAFLNRFEYARVSIPMAILIWLMIYPMMMKVDFQSIRNVGKNPKGLLPISNRRRRTIYLFSDEGAADFHFSRQEKL